jgi:hypothetical protein
MLGFALLSPTYGTPSPTCGWRGKNRIYRMSERKNLNRLLSPPPLVGEGARVGWAEQREAQHWRERVYFLFFTPHPTADTLDVS